MASMMSASGHERKSRTMILMSALPPTADNKRRVRHVRYVPLTEVAEASGARDHKLIAKAALRC